MALTFSTSGLTGGFNSAGATPNQGFPTGNSNSTPSTPKGIALSNASSLPIRQTPVLPVPPPQPVKSHSVGADGSVTQTYHAPEVKGATSTTSSVTPETTPNPQNYDIQTGLLTATGKANGLPDINAPKTTPAPDNSYGGLINRLADTSSAGNPQVSQDVNQARADYANAGNTNYIIGRSEQDALHNPNYSLDTGIGRAGQIASNYGLMGQNALTQAQGENALAQTGNTQQGLIQSGLTSAIGAKAPITQSAGGATVPIDPTTGQPIGGGTTGNALNSIAQTGATASNVADFTQKYAQGTAKLNAADGIQTQIVNTLKSNPDLNTSPISLLTNLNQLVSGQLGSAPQQQLAQLVNSYIQTLGIDPATLVNIATQQKGTMADLLESLRQTAQSQTEAYNPSNLTEANNPANIKNENPTGGGNSISGFGWSGN